MKISSVVNTVPNKKEKIKSIWKKAKKLSIFGDVLSIAKDTAFLNVTLSKGIFEY